MRIFKAILFLLFVTVLLPVYHVQAADNYNCAYLKPIDWRETHSQAFVFIFPPQYENLVNDLILPYKDTLDEIYVRFNSVFESNLAAPISIRVYPDVDYYYCLNALAPEIGDGQFHSHIGSKEIAVIGDNIIANQPEWEKQALNIFRNELAILMVQQITDKKAPAGLLAGIGGYAQDPVEFVGAQPTLGGVPETIGDSWRGVWEDESTLISPTLTIQATSMIAYLVDAYGWPYLIKYLESLPTADGYLYPLRDIYGLEVSTLQEQWQQYYPLYLNERWRAHAIYNFDLSKFEGLIQAGAYTDASRGLLEAIAFLEKIGDSQKLAQAQALLIKSKTGEEAGVLTAQSRLALQNGNYEKSIELAAQAEEKYSQLNDNRRLEELSAYRKRAEEILNLRAELDAIKANPTGGLFYSSTVSELVRKGNRLAELQDSEGEAMVRSMLNEYRNRQYRQQMILSGIGILLCLILLAARLRLSRLKPRREALI